MIGVMGLCSVVGNSVYLDQAPGTQCRLSSIHIYKQTNLLHSPD